MKLHAIGFRVGVITLLLFMTHLSQASSNKLINDKMYKNEVTKLMSLGNVNLSCALYGVVTGAYNEETAKYKEHNKLGAQLFDKVKEITRFYIIDLKRGSGDEKKISRLKKMDDISILEESNDSLLKIYKEKGPSGIEGIIRKILDAEEANILPLWLNTCRDVANYSMLVLQE